LAVELCGGQFVERGELALAAEQLEQLDQPVVLVGRLRKRRVTVLRGDRGIIVRANAFGRGQPATRKRRGGRNCTSRRGGARRTSESRQWSSRSHHTHQVCRRDAASLWPGTPGSLSGRTSSTKRATSLRAPLGALLSSPSQCPCATRRANCARHGKGETETLAIRRHR
jgi:hypothetical protein